MLNSISESLIFPSGIFTLVFDRLLRYVNISSRDHHVPLASSSPFLERRVRSGFDAINEITPRSVRQINLFLSYKLRAPLARIHFAS